MVQALIVLGLLVMAYNMFTGSQMRREAPGGIIGERLSQLNLFIGFFTLGYLGIALLVWGRAVDLLLVIVALILLFGAIFVLLVLRLVQAILKALGG